MGEHFAFWIWFSVLCIACASASVMATILTIKGPVL